MHCVLTTPAFAKSAKQMGLDESAINEIVTMVARDPTLGDLIPGTGGARKFRIPVRDKGKRSGGRVVSFYAAEDVPVFLLDIYAKGERISLSKAERNELKSILGDLAEDYQRTMRERVAMLKKTGTE